MTLGSAQGCDADVIVVGLGPVGAVLAGLLGRRGISVMAFDRLPHIYPQPRAIVFDHEAMRIMQELGIAERVAPLTGAYRPSEYRGVDGQVIRKFDFAAPPYRLGWAPNCTFDQPGFELALRALLEELPTVQAHWPNEVLSAVPDASGVTVRVQPEGESPRCLRAGWLVACDGGASPIRKAMGIGLKDLGFDESWIVIDALVNEDKIGSLPAVMVQFCDPKRPATFVIGPGRHRRWEIMMLPGDRFSEGLPEHELWPLLDRWIRPGDAVLRRAAAYRFHGLVAQTWRQGRVLLAGDSAHMTPPFIGQGMVQGLRDAHNLAWKLERVIRAQSDEALLDSYGEERSPHVEATTRVAIDLGRVICELDEERAKARDAAILAQQGGIVRTTIRQSLIPGLQNGLIAVNTPGAGETLPQPRVCAKGASDTLLDDLTGACLRVIAVEDATDGETAALAAAVEPEQGVVVKLCAEFSCEADGHRLDVVESAPVLAPWLHALKARFAIARPDHYVYATAPDLQTALAAVSALRVGLR
jgi:3-(3-hydroxy-phenyl)propionate hydroxylase